MWSLQPIYKKITASKFSVGLPANNPWARPKSFIWKQGYGHVKGRSDR